MKDTVNLPVEIKAQNFYSYFKECYKLDYKEFTINNILSTKYSFKWFASGQEELVHDELPIIPYPNKKTLDLEKEIELYQLEKKLFYAAFFILGKNNNPLIKDKRICAPLVLFPANIKTIEDEKYLEIEANAFVINQTILSKLETKSSNLTKDMFLADLTEILSGDKSNLIALHSLFEKYFSNIDAKELLLYPNVWSANKIRKHLTETEYAEEQYKIVPAAGTVLIEKSESALKVLNDLSELAQKAEFDSSFDALLNHQDPKNNFTFSYYKSRLNKEQYSALKNAYRYSNSVIVGPPGTGKSYTITSIVSDAIVNDQSVLIVSKTKQAVEVLRNMLIDDFKLRNYLIHTSGSRYLFSLKSKLRKYLSGISPQDYQIFNSNRIQNLYEELEDLEKQFEHLVDRELQISDLEFNNNLNFIDKWRKFYLKTFLSNGEKIWALFDQINEVVAKLDKEISTYSRFKIQTNINNNCNRYRIDLGAFHDALDTTSFTESMKLMSGVNHESILKVFPIWLANLSDLNAVLPLQKELFDLVIIDEATQCDIASALPAIYRAKRAVVVGDPNQLRHYSFVSRAQQANLRSKYNLPDNKLFDYRNKSILDVFLSNVPNQDQVTFLREHFRSTPSLIEFSNQQFYDGQLKVIKSTPQHTANNQIELIHVEGERNGKGINEIEANEVISKLKEIINDNTDIKTPPSLGIISPFSSQVTYINKLLREDFELDTIKKFNILCGTPYNFQGSERDVILLSFGVCNNTHSSAFIHLNKPEVFNVAITRAKSFQIIFTSVTVDTLKTDSLLYQYLKFIEKFTHSEQDQMEVDEFQHDVVAELKKLKLDNIQCGYHLAGSLLDILVTHNDKSYFIDLIGYPGFFKEALSFERYKTFARTGVKTFPLHYSYWTKEKTKAIERLKSFIHYNK